MSSWLTSAIQSVREKSLDALDFVRKDLTEFTTTVKTDTETYINKIKTQEVGDLGINRFVSKFSDTGKTDNDSGKHIHASNSLDRVQNELVRIQNDESTYLTEPTPPEAFESWRQTSDFNVETRKGEIAQLLIDAPHVRSFYAHLVPAETTHSDFWSRYYFRVHQIEEEEARRTQLLRRAQEICSENTDNTGENDANDWDEPEEEWPKESSNTVEIKPVVQMQEEPLKTVEEILPTQSPTTENKRTESDTVSGDSWERDFDETDLVSSSKVEQNQIIESAVTDTPETSTITTETAHSSSTEKKPNPEVDEDWEAWS